MDYYGEPCILQPKKSCTPMYCIYHHFNQCKKVAPYERRHFTGYKILIKVIHIYHKHFLSLLDPYVNHGRRYEGYTLVFLIEIFSGYTCPCDLMIVYNPMYTTKVDIIGMVNNMSLGPVLYC